MTKPILTDEQIAEIRAREQAAMSGPWIRKNGQILCRLGSGDLLKMGGGFDQEDAEFVVHARQDIPLLLAEIDRWKARAEEAEGKVAALERSVLNLSGCNACIYVTVPEHKKPCFECEGVNWQFDYARFSGQANTGAAGGVLF